MRHISLRTLSSLLGVVLFALALLALYHELQAYHYRDVVQHLGEIPAARLLGALGLVLLSYGGLVGYDILALYYIRRVLPYHHIVLTSFISYALSHTMGLAIVSGGAVRYRLYSTFGLSALDIAQVIAFCSLTFWLGFALLAGLAFCLASLPLPVPALSLQCLGVVALLLPVGYLCASMVCHKPFKWRRWEFFWPSPAIAGGQVVVSMVEWSTAAGVLYILLPPGTPLSYLQVLGLFLLAQMTGVMSQVPGGLGVFETMLLLWLSPLVSPPSLLGTLLVYRGVYYLLPFGIAAILLGAYEVQQHQESVWDRRA